MSDSIVEAEHVGSGYDGLTLEELSTRRTMKWSLDPQGVIPAWVAEMDFPIAPAIRRALIEAVQRGETGYPPEHQVSPLPEACAGWLRRSFGLQVDAEQICTLPDVLRGVQLAIELFSRSESPVVITTPSYPPFFGAVHLTGRCVIEAPVAVDSGRYVFDLEAIEAALRAGAGSVILCNPYNPLGRVFSRDELLALTEVVDRHGARVIADEVHAPLVYPGSSHVSYSTVSEVASHHSVTLTSASKGWNIPGLKCAQMILTNPVDIAIMRQVPFPRTWGMSVLGVIANTVAYQQGGLWLQEVVAYLDGNRKLLADLLSQHLPDVHYTVPEATYLAWLDCRALELADPAGFFLERAHVRLESGAGFGAPGSGYVRLNFATSRAILTEIVDRMAAAIHTAR